MRMQASAFNVGSDITMQRFGFCKIIIRSNYLRNESNIFSVDRGINQKKDGKMYQCA